MACLKKKKSCHVIVTQGKSFLLIVNTDQSTMIVDSHSHIGSGALISFAPPGHAADLAVWFTRMSRNTWNYELGTTSVISVNYVAEVHSLLYLESLLCMFCLLDEGLFDHVQL